MHARLRPLAAIAGIAIAASAFAVPMLVAADAEVAIVVREAVVERVKAPVGNRCYVIATKSAERSIRNITGDFVGVYATADCSGELVGDEVAPGPTSQIGPTVKSFKVLG